MPTAVTRRLTAAAVAAVALAVPLAPAAATPAAPACTAPTLRAAVQAADAVFVGTVESATASGDSFVHEVTVERIYRGTVTATDVQVTTRAGRCELGQLTGQPYVFFARGSGTTWAAAGQGGTAPASAAVVTRVEALLGAGQAPAPPEPEAAEITPVDTDPPRSFTRLAAPGLALVLVGLLGLVVTRRLDRR